MSKNKKGNAAPQVANSQPKTPDNKVESTKVETPAIETKKEEANPQVTAPTATEKSEGNTPPPAVKTPSTEKPKEEKAKSQPKTSAPKGGKIPTVIAEEVSDENAAQKALTKMGTLASGVQIGSTKSSTDAKAMLAHVGYNMFVNNPDFKASNPEQHKAMCQSVTAVWFLGMIGVQNEYAELDPNSGVQLLVGVDQIMPLQEIASMLGVKLTAPKALPNKFDEPEQLAIEFEKGGIPAELKEVPKAKAIPSLKHEDIDTPEKVNEVLDYLMRKERNIAINIANTVEWYREHCILAESNVDKRLALDDRKTSDWIFEIFHLIEPGALFKGLGRSVYLYTKTQGSPCTAHALLHTPLSEKGWSEEQIADTLKAIIQENFRYSLKTDPAKKATEDEAIRAVIGNLGNDYLDTLISDYNLNTTSDDATIRCEKELLKKEARKVITMVRSAYLSNRPNPTMDETRMVLGQILNLYRDPMDRLSEYMSCDVLTSHTADYPATEKPAEVKTDATAPVEKTAETEKKN